ncbi:UNVERIFIED_CONTAM: hypothetical protein LK11_54720 [Mumia flava]
MHDQPAAAEVTRLVDGYLNAWNEVDHTERIQIIEQCWEVDGALVDPPMDGQGHAGIDALVRALHEHYPRHRFVRCGEVESHHDAFRFRWRLVGPDGTDALTGVDYGLVGDGGRIARVTGFFDASQDADGTGAGR